MADIINGIPYPGNVVDEATFFEWLLFIERESETGDVRQGFYREVLKYAYFNREDEKSSAVQSVCQQTAMTLFSHLIKAPNAKIVWRVKPEFEVFEDTIPSDLMQVMSRSQIDEVLKTQSRVSLDEARKVLNKEDWASDFCTDSIFPVAAPEGVWKIFKSYMRYAVILGDEVIPHPMERN